jgi:hypothetical protein
MKQVVTALLLTCAGVSLAVAADTPQSAKGEKWKVTSSMQMAGMSLPAQSSEFCKEPGADAVPVKTDKNCEVYDVTRSGNVQSFKMRCTGKDAMEGTGQFTYLGADHYQGKMQVKTGGETMTMSYEGQKLGACDGGETNLKAKQMLADAKQQQIEADKAEKERCHKMAADASSPDVMKAYCKDPEDRKVFCSAVATHDKFLPLAKAERANRGINRPLTDAAEVCGFDIKKQRAQLCQSAESQDKLEFLGSECPVEAATLAQAHCAGRRYTAISDKYRGFCATYASNQPADDSPAGKVKGLFDKGKKGIGGIGGLFGN